MLKGELKPLSEGLTKRQWQIIPMVAAGKRNREIAASLGIGVDTVKVYMSVIMKKLKLNGRLQVALWWRDRQGKI